MKPLKVEVALSLNSSANFSYEWKGDPEYIKEGIRVIVPVWNRVTSGWIVNTKSEYQGRVKSIIGIIKDEYIPDKNYLKFVSEISRTFMISAGKILDTSISPGMRSLTNLYFKFDDLERPFYKRSAKELEEISKSGGVEFFYKIKGSEIQGLQKKVEDQTDDKNKPDHLIYLNYYRSDYYQKIWLKERSSGRTPLMLLPNNLSMDKYKNAMSDLQIYNSRIKSVERERIWRLARGNDPVFIGGGESALFLPIKHPGAIIIEKPGSFFYDKNISSGIDLRKVARIKAEIMGVDIIEGNSSLTSFHQYNRESLNIIDERAADVRPVSVKKLNPGTRVPPDQVTDSIINNFAKGDRVLVIVSKKGSLKFLFCGECKNIFKCPLCSGSVTISANNKINCMSCSYTHKKPETCEKCNSELKVIEDISVSSLKKKLILRAGETSVISFDAKLSGDYVTILKRAETGGNNIVILTPAEVNSISEGSFDSVLFLKPESFFDLNNFKGGEQIFSFIGGLREILSPEGKIDIYSVFHFHYSMKNINDEVQYLVRELKYREFFLLPPYFDVFNIELSDRDLRILSGRMRDIYKDFKDILNIRRINLLSRSKMRGFYKGSIQIHTGKEKVFKSGILNLKGIRVKGLY